MYTEAEEGRNDFKAIKLPWNLHPDRVAPVDSTWEARERANMSPREFAQEYDCDFLGSGNSLIDAGTLAFYDQTFIQEPVEKRFMGSDFWVWEYPDYSKQYIVCADVARGDGSDFSTFHVIEASNCEQVAEYKSQIDTRSFGNMLVSVATEYNNALLVVENANIGWDVINTIIEKGYPNLYYSPRSYGELNMDQWMAKMESNQKVPGFTTSTKTRPLVIAKLEAYIRERNFIFHSKRLLEELRVFVWMNGKAQSQNGYNDDLVMALGIGLFTRDTALKFHEQGLDISRAAVDGITRVGVGGGWSGNFGTVYLPNGQQNPYMVGNGNGVYEDMTWMMG